MYQSYRPELWAGFYNDHMQLKNEGFGGGLDFVLFGGTSTNKNNLANYFLPNCHNGLSTREIITETEQSDLDAINFNIVTTNGIADDTTSGFLSESCFQAQESVAGLGLHYKQAFWHRDNNSKWFYVDVSSSLQQVRHKITICEDITDDGGGAATDVLPQAVGSLTEAMNQAAWDFGKINSGCTMKKAGLADIEFKVGHEWWHDHCHYAGYAGVLIPTGNKAKGEYVFEPIVGHGKYFGFMMGFEADAIVWTSRCEKWDADFNFAANGLYLFKNTQVRSFDLKNKPWSRYIAMYASEADAQAAADLEDSDAVQAQYNATPGINILTRCVNVTPGFAFNATTNILLRRYCGFQAELGYNLFARQHECVTLAQPWQTGPAIKALSGNGETNPVANISGNFLLSSIEPVTLANYETSLIQASDLDLNSAAHPNILVNLFYATLGYRWNKEHCPMDLNIGVAYEFAERTFAVMNRLSGWIKYGLSF